MAENNETRFQFIDEDKELSREAYDDNERTALGMEPAPQDADQPVASQEEASPEESSPEVEAASETGDNDEVQQDDSIQVGEKQFTGVESLKDSYKNLESLYGKQTNELGELRQEVASLKGQREEPAQPAPELDVYDPKTYDSYFGHKVDEAVDARMKKQQAKDTQKQVDRAYNDMIGQFNKDHPEMSNDEKMKVARFADKRGITFLEDAYQVMQAGDVAQKAKSQGVKEVTEKLQSATKVPKTLSSVSGSPSVTAPDVDRLSENEWSRLSEDERWRALQDAPMG